MQQKCPIKTSEGTECTSCLTLLTEPDLRDEFGRPGVRANDETLCQQCARDEGWVIDLVDFTERGESINMVAYTNDRPSAPEPSDDSSSRGSFAGERPTSGGRIVAHVNGVPVNEHELNEAHKGIFGEETTTTFLDKN